MSQSLSKNQIHLVFSTKNRAAVLHDGIRSRLFGYMTGIFEEWESPSIQIGGIEDHIHALFVLSKNFALKKLVEELKKGSSKWMKTQGREFAKFYWQAGYGAFSVSESNVEQVTQYIAKQPEHHRKKNFQAEFRELLQAHKISFDERYVWD